MGLGVTYKNQILSNLCGKLGQVNLCNNCYIGLLDANGTEPNASTGYTRVVLGLQAQAETQCMGAPSNGVITNTKPITFPVAETNWDVTVTQFGLYSSLSASDPVFTGTLTASVLVLKDYIATFTAGSLTISIV